MACECGQCPTDICHGWGNIEEMEMRTTILVKNNL